MKINFRLLTVSILLLTGCNNKKSNIGIVFNYRTRIVRHHMSNNTVHQPKVYDACSQYSLVYVYAKGEICMNWRTYDKLTKSYANSYTCDKYGVVYKKHVGSYNDFLYELATILSTGLP